jgi:hypothetical protein
MAVTDNSMQSMLQPPVQPEVMPQQSVNAQPAAPQPAEDPTDPERKALLDKLYEQYRAQNYSLQQAWRKMYSDVGTSLDGADRLYMKELYETVSVAGPDKKKSQGELPSGSNLEEVSTEPSSSPQAQPSGSGTVSRDALEDIVESMMPSSLNIPEGTFKDTKDLVYPTHHFVNDKLEFRTNAVDQPRINPTTILNNQPDEVADRLVFEMFARNFDFWAQSLALPGGVEEIPESGQKYRERKTGFEDLDFTEALKGEDEKAPFRNIYQLKNITGGPLWEGLPDAIAGKDGSPTWARYDDVLGLLARAYVLNDEIMGSLYEGEQSLEEAVANNLDPDEWRISPMTPTLDDPDSIERRKKRNRARQVQKEIDKKKEELEQEFLQDIFAQKFLQALPMDYWEVNEEETGLSDRALLLRSQLEGQFSKRYGWNLDFSGDKVVKKGKPKLSLETDYLGRTYIGGEWADRAGAAFENAGNSIAWWSVSTWNKLQSWDPLRSRLEKEEAKYLDEYYYMVYGPNQPIEGTKMTEAEYARYITLQDIDMKINNAQARHAKVAEDFDVYLEDITTSIANGNFQNAFEQSMAMTADGLPYMVMMAGSSYLGPGGTAAMMAALGGMEEATRIRNDISFDSFTDKETGEVLTYYEAADRIGTYDPVELRMAFDFERNDAGRFGYLSAVVAGDFAQAFAMNRALTGSYKSVAQKELKNWFNGYMLGTGLAVSETSAAVVFKNVLMEAGAAIEQGREVDWEMITENSLNQVLGFIPQTLLMHTLGSATRYINGSKQSNSVIPKNAEQLEALDNLIRDYTAKIRGSRDPRFIAEANQVIRNARTSANMLRSTSAAYLDYLRQNNPDAFLEVSNSLTMMDSLKLRYNATNDPNLRIQLKQQAADHLQGLNEIYDQHLVGFEESTRAGGRMGVKEREAQREAAGITLEDAQRAAAMRTTPQQRTDMGEGVGGEAPPSTPLSRDGARNDRTAATRRWAQTARDVWNKWFRSSGGMKNEQVMEVVRSRERLNAAWVNEVGFDARSWRELLKSVRRPDGMMGRRLGKAELKDTQAAMREFIEGKLDINDPRLKPLNADARQQLTFFREQIDGMSNQLIELLERQPAGTPEQQQAKARLIETIKSNRGQYLTTSYELFHDGGKRLNQLTGPRENMNPSVRRAYDEAVEAIANRYDNDVVSDTPMPYAERRARAQQELNQYLMGLKEAQGGQRTTFGLMGAMDAPFLKGKKNLPPWMENLLGKIDDPMFAYIATSSKLNSYIANTRWQTELALVLQDTGLSRLGREFDGQESPMGKMVRLAPETEAWAPLYDVFVPESVKAAYDNLGPLKSIESEGYRRLVGLSASVKLGKTVLAPTTMARNFMSGTALAAANGHVPFLTNPRITLTAMETAWGVHGKYKRNSTYRAEMKKLIELGVLQDGAKAGELMQVLNDSMGGDVNRILKENTSLTKRAKGLMQKMYAFGDDFYKVNGYYQERQMLIDSGESVARAEAIAAERVRDGYPTYSKISRGAKELRRFPVLGSFPSFTYEMWRTTGNQLKFIHQDLQAGRNTMAMRRAAGFLTAITSGYTLAEASMDRLGLTDEDDAAIKTLVPPWQRGSALLYTGADRGKPEFVDLTYMLPHETITKPFRILMGGDPLDDGLWDQTWGAFTEAGSAFFSSDVAFTFAQELFMNASMDDGRRIYDTAPGQTNGEYLLSADGAQTVFLHFLKTTAPGFVSNLTEFTRAGAVEEAWSLLTGGEELPNGHPLEEAMDKFYQIYPQKTKYTEYTMEKATAGALGIRYSTVNVDVAGSYQVKEWNDWQHKQKYQQFKPLINQPELASDGQLEDAVGEYVDIFEHNTEQIQRLTNTMAHLSMSVAEIETALDRAGVSDEDAGFYLMDLYVPPALITDQQIDAMIENNMWPMGVTQDEKIEWAVTISKNAAAFNLKVIDHIVKRCQELGYSKEQTQSIVNQAQQGGKNEDGTNAAPQGAQED